MVGFQDTVSFSFLALSVCDLCFIITKNIVNLCNAVALVERPIMDTVHGGLDTIVFYGEMLFDISACVKTFIAVQRSCCVAFQFLVNRIFTKGSTLGVIFCLYLFNLVSYSTDEFMKWQTGFQSSTNHVTYYTQVFTSDWPVYNTVRRFLKRTAVVCACEILVLLSLIFIVYDMSSTSKWRQSLSVGKINKHQSSSLWRKISCLFMNNGKYASNHLNNAQHKQTHNKKTKTGTGQTRTQNSETSCPDFYHASDVLHACRDKFCCV